MWFLGDFTPGSDGPGGCLWQALPIARLPLPHPAPSPAPRRGAEGLRDAQGPVSGIFSIFLENADSAAQVSGTVP